MKALITVFVAMTFAQVATANNYSFSCKTSDGKIVLSEKRAIVYSDSNPMVLDFPNIESSLMRGVVLNYSSELGDVVSFEVKDIVRKGVISEENNGPCPNPDEGYTHGQVTEKVRIQGEWYAYGLPARTVQLTCIEKQTWQGTCYQQ